MTSATHRALTWEEMKELVDLSIKILNTLHLRLEENPENPALEAIVISEMIKVRDECGDVIESAIPKPESKSEVQPESKSEFSQACYLLKYISSYHRSVTGILC